MSLFPFFGCSRELTLEDDSVFVSASGDVFLVVEEGQFVWGERLQITEGGAYFYRTYAGKAEFVDPDTLVLHPEEGERALAFRFEGNALYKSENRVVTLNRLPVSRSLSRLDQTGVHLGVGTDFEARWTLENEGRLRIFPQQVATVQPGNLGFGLTISTERELYAIPLSSPDLVAGLLILNHVEQTAFWAPAVAL